MLHSNSYVMTIHVLRTNFPISREVPLDPGHCQGLHKMKLDFSCGCVPRGMERHSCLIRLLGMMFFQVRLYAT